MSFGESIFLAGFIQKTTKGDLFVKGNHRIPPRKQRGKTLEDSRRLSTKADVTEPTNYTKLSKKIIHQSRRLNELKPV